MDATLLPEQGSGGRTARADRLETVMGGLRYRPTTTGAASLTPRTAATTTSGRSSCR